MFYLSVRISSKLSFFCCIVLIYTTTSPPKYKTFKQFNYTAKRLTEGVLDSSVYILTGPLCLVFLRLFRKYVFGEADEIELKFVNR